MTINHNAATDSPVNVDAYDATLPLKLTRVGRTVATVGALFTWLREFRASVRDFIEGEYETEVVSHRTGMRKERERERMRKRRLLADLERRRAELMNEGMGR